MSDSWAIVASDFVRTGGMDVANLGLARRLAERAQVTLITHRVDESLKNIPSIEIRNVSKPWNIQILGEGRIASEAARYQRSVGLNRQQAVANGGNCFWPNSINWVHYVHAAYNPVVHGSLLRRLKAWYHRRRSIIWEKRALEMAKLVICNSDLTRRQIVELVGITESKTRTVYYGVDPSVFRPADSALKQQHRDFFGWDHKVPRIMFVGALGDRRKGFDTLATAWEELCKDPTWTARLSVVGSGAEKVVWEKRLATGSSHGTVEFLGFRDDVPKLLQAADALVAPTRYEAYGLGVHEAICCGLPSIVSANSGVAERYPASLHDYLIRDPDDIQELIALLRRWFLHREEIRSQWLKFSDLLRSRTWDDMADEIIELAKESNVDQ
jgi:glycosyltransferase involved in cell wall biosynthesis